LTTHRGPRTARAARGGCRATHRDGRMRAKPVVGRRCLRCDAARGKPTGHDMEGRRRRGVVMVWRRHTPLASFSWQRVELRPAGRMPGKSRFGPGMLEPPDGRELAAASQPGRGGDRVGGHGVGDGAIHTYRQTGLHRRRVQTAINSRCLRVHCRWPSPCTSWPAAGQYRPHETTATGEMPLCTTAGWLQGGRCGMLSGVAPMQRMCRPRHQHHLATPLDDVQLCRCTTGPSPNLPSCNSRVATLLHPRPTNRSRRR
jgi:hypothetical protein